MDIAFGNIARCPFFQIPTQVVYRDIYSSESLRISRVLHLDLSHRSRSIAVDYMISLLSCHVATMAIDGARLLSSIGIQPGLGIVDEEELCINKR